MTIAESSDTDVMSVTASDSPPEAPEMGNVNTNNEAKAVPENPDGVEDSADTTPKTWRFWLVFVSLCVVSLTTSLDNTILTVALPTVTREIGGDEHYVWISSSFLLSSTVVQPFIGQLANIFGRRWPMLTSVGFFILGSGIGGGATNVGMLIAGRTIQGVGGGGIFVLLDIITCDMVPLRERGKYLGMVISSGGIGATLGPLIGGAIAQANWRWVFYINLPLGGAALVVLFFFLRVKHIEQASWEKALARIDYFGVTLFMGSMTAILLGLIMGGVTYGWGTYHIIVPIVIGFVGWAAFHVYEATGLCKEPSVPPHLFGNRTSFVGFFLAFLASFLLMWAAVFLPVYYQGVLGASPFRSAVDLLPFNIFLIPASMIAGGMMAKLGQYKPLHWAGFGISAIGFGLFTLLGPGSSKAAWVCFEIIASIGVGILMISILPAIQASLSDADNASSASLFSFLRSFGFLWGITVPAIIFNNETDRSLHLVSDPKVVAALADGKAYSHVSGGFVQSLSPEAQKQVIAVFNAGLKPVWQAGIAFCLAGFVLTFVEKHVKMRTQLETDYGLETEKKTKDAEMNSEEKH
ncbi:MFS general substrate transporter [Zopfia rhizophila CBS 207.26]|uniref:MFS general substrate transporter n=1 Tax=Zopfia rhizophila CBS 207.26 TaxID=1314779 RepID=A0A6A6DLE3_9PEZI|nr:MFS general substrate transporter [Zopfia rhizophila CBS 207.26]